MMKKHYNIKTISIASTAALLTAVISTSALAWGWGKESRKSHIIEEVNEELTLTQAQQDSLKEVADAFFDFRGQQKDQRKKLRLETEDQAKSFWSNPNLLAADIINHLKAEQGKRQNLMEQQATPVAEKMSAFHATLNEQQRDKFATLMAEKMPRFYGRFGGKHRGGKHDDHDDCDDDD